MRQYDIHTHILPAMDDGAKDKEQSKIMLQMLKEQGITDVVLTPHYYPFESPLKSFLKKREECYEAIKDTFTELGLTAHIGAEVYFSDVLFAQDSLNELCIDGGNYILIELPFGETKKQKIIDSLYQLSGNYSVRIILAHLNRYPKFFKKDFMYEVSRIGCLVQVDAKVLDNVFKRKKVLKYIDEGLINLVGSDCHNSTTRKPTFDFLKKNLDEKTYQKLLEAFDNVK